MMRITALMVTGVTLVLMSVGCTTRKVNAEANIDPASVKVESAPDVNVVRIEKPQSVKLFVVDQQSVRDELRVTGSVAPDVTRTVPVVSLTSGRVVTTAARLGDQVRKGQILLTLTSPDVAMAFADYAKFQADEQLARTQLARVQLLFSRGAAAQKDVQLAEDTAAKAAVDVRTVSERIRILGADPEHPSSVLEIKSPASGTIIEQNITAGTAVKSVDNSPNLFTIADLSSVWILCDVFENDLAKVHLGDMAEVRLNAFPDRTLKARVSNIGRLLDPQTRAVKVRLELANPGDLLKPNMFAAVTFHSQSSHTRPVVPASAVLHLHDRDWVFRRESDTQFRRVEIQSGLSLPEGMQEVLAGITPGDRIVAKALEFESIAESRQ